MQHFIITLTGRGLHFIKKEILGQVFSCEFCEISKNTFFKGHLWTTASVEKDGFVSFRERNIQMLATDM